MKRFHKKYLLIFMLVGIFLFAGCDKFKFGTFKSSDDDAVAGVTVIPDDEKDSSKATKQNTLQKDDADSTLSPTDSAASPTQKTLSETELQIYTIDDKPELVPVSVLVSAGSEITPELIVDKVIESLADQSITIACDSVMTKDDTVIVSFKKDHAPYTQMGSEFEENILNAFAQSLLDNITSVKKVIFRIEGKAYASGSFEYKIDEPYMSE